MFASFNRPGWRAGAVDKGTFMSISIALLMALQASSGGASPCAKLMRDFAENENTYGIIYDTNMSLLEISKKYGTTAEVRSRIISRSLRRTRSSKMMEIGSSI